MGPELHDLMVNIAGHAAAVVDSALSSVLALYSAGASNGLDPGPLVVGGAAGAAAGGAAASGGAGQGHRPPSRWSLPPDPPSAEEQNRQAERERVRNIMREEFGVERPWIYGN